MLSAPGPRHTVNITEKKTAQFSLLIYKTPRKLCSVLLCQNGSNGKKFEDFSSLEIAIQQYQKEENVQFLRRSSRTIEKAQINIFGAQLEESSRRDGSFEHQKLTLKVIENTIVHTIRPSVRLSVRTI